ncbi:uncharacterized protein At5g41620-like [Apium graveolens]|uniref:uncharacterized protein At5g41620-like n=1 Tax=Apium graveolens TaxID=4045 RepID=UPI003D79EF53
MPQRNLMNEERKLGEKCKIRKRGGSSSSSSSLVQNFRLKRAILVRKRGGSSTPVPSWKMSTRLSPLHSDQVTGKVKEASMSARKLAATLWEIDEAPSHNLKTKVDKGRKETTVRRSTDLSQIPVSEYMDRHKTRKSVASTKVVLTDKSYRGMDSLPNANLIKVEIPPHRRSVATMTRLKDIKEGLITSKELLKVLNHTWELEEQRSTCISIMNALKFELHCARVKVEKLIQEQQPNHSEIDYLLKQFAEERSAWKMKERSRIHDAVKSLAGEIETEKRLRRQTERINKKLGRELVVTKDSLSKAENDIEGERRAREILEQVCDELARGIGDDRAQVEELKKESVKVREEVEKEREMLQLADVLREERVQMKLSEARYQFEEKNDAVEKLKSELESYLRTEKGEEKGHDFPNNDRIKELKEYLKKTLIQPCLQGDDRGRNDSPDSDDQSIELNMDCNGKTFGWSYTGRFDAQNDEDIISSTEETVERNLCSDRKQKKPSYLERQISDGIVWEFNTKLKEDSDGLSKERVFEFTSQNQKEDYENEIQRYKMIKDLRDHIVSGSGLAMLQGAA